MWLRLDQKYFGLTGEVDCEGKARPLSDKEQGEGRFLQFKSAQQDKLARGYSSAGRASGLHPEGPRFDPA